MIIRPGAIGDCILSLPALEHLKSDYTEVWAPSPVKSLIRFADRVRSIASTGLDLLGLPDVEPPPQLVTELRIFDHIVSWYGTNRPEFRQVCSDLGLPVEFLRALPEADCQMHCADFFAGQVGAPTPAFPKIGVGIQPAEPFIAIHPFSGGARKNWPLDRFQELARRLPLPVLWCAERFEDLYELGCWIARSALYIGNDSGITHLAAAVGAPVTTIFGPTDPAIWAPRGEHVRIVHGELADIQVEQVLEAARSLLRLR